MNEEEFEEKLIEFMRLTNKHKEEIIEEMVDLFSWTIDQYQHHRTIASIDINGDVKKVYTLPIPEDMILTKLEESLALVKKEDSEEFNRIGKIEYHDWRESGEIGLLLANRTKLFICYDKDIEVYLRKPSTIELNPNSRIYSFTFKKFLENYGKRKGNLDKLRKDYQILFNENLPKPANNKFKVVPK